MVRRSLGLLVLVAIAVAWSTGVAGAADVTIKQGAKKCHLLKHLSDQGKTITLDTEGEDDLGVGDSYDDVLCVLRALKAPSYIRTEMENTRALDGMQKGRWNSFRASWTYHPDDGLNLVIYDPS